MSRKVIIVAVFLIFLAPVIGSVLVHSNWINWQPGQTRNHGELIQPPVTLFATGTNLESPPTDRPGKDQWILLEVQTSACQSECLEQLYWLRQIRRAQDRHQPDIALMLISSEELDGATREQVLALADDFLIIDGDEASELIARLPAPAGGSSFIVDPQGRLVLRYEPDADPNGIRRDLRRLVTWTVRE